MSILEQLNNRQREAASCTDSHVRIIAGAGSGKTRVVTVRIAYLIDECHVYPNRILAITFTNKAAREMKERVESMLGPLAASVRISTIHSFCVRLLREDIQEIGYPRSFTILDSEDQKSILKEIYKEKEIDAKSYAYGAVLAYISSCKTVFVDPQRALQLAQSESQRVKANVYASYEQRLRDMFALDFDDLLIKAHEILKGREDVREKWQRRFDYIHVDEFQDVDELQYDIVKLLCAPQTKLCVVGDPDQTIYTWRGADVDIIMNFERDFEGCKTVILDENYRSKAHILEGANALIRNNRNRIKKDLFTRQHSDEKIVHFSAADDRNEPVWVAARIASLHHSGVPYREIAVLYRSNYLSRGLEKALLEAHVPYRIYGGIRFYERAEIKDALSYLRLLAPKHETDERELWKDLAVRRVINAPKRGIGARSLEQLEEQARSEDTNLYEVLKHPCIKGAKACRGIEEFVRVIEECREAAASLSIDMLMKKVLERSGYLQMLQDDNENERLENIKELLNDMEEYVENDPEATLDDYLQEIALYTDNENDAGGEVVQLMSVHASKGLEFDCVFIYSLCEGIFPSERSISEGGGAALEEERRLAYVAMTRARKQLFLSDSMGYSYVLDRIKMPSRFVKEIPRTLMEDVGAKPRSRFGDDVDVFSEGGFSSISRPAPVSSASSSPARKKRRGKLQKGDLVQHTSFGEGIVISVKDNLATIAFEQRYGVRKIMADHPSLSRK